MEPYHKWPLMFGFFHVMYFQAVAGKILRLSYDLGMPTGWPWGTLCPVLSEWTLGSLLLVGHGANTSLKGVCKLSCEHIFHFLGTAMAWVWLVPAKGHVGIGLPV